MRTGAEAEVLELRLPAVTLSALAWGPVDGPLVLALHGFPDTAHTWRHLGPHLAALGHRVVAPHLRGYAPSGLADDGCYAVGALMADAVALHEALDGDDRAALVGHDWGAIAAGGLAAHPRSPYRRVVTMAVPPLALMGPQPPRVMLRQARNSWYVAFNQLPRLPERVLAPLVRRLWRDWSPGYDATEDLRHVQAALAGRGHRAAALAYYRTVPRPWRVPAAYRDWQRTWTESPRVPVLHLHGADDGCLHPRFADGVGCRLPPGSRSETVAGAGHFLQVERPAAVHEAVAAFLADPGPGHDPGPDAPDHGGGVN